MNLEDQIRALLEAQGKADQEQDSDDSTAEKQQPQSDSSEPEQQPDPNAQEQPEEQPAVSLDNPITPGLAAPDVISPQSEIEAANQEGAEDIEEEDRKKNAVTNESLIDLLGDDFSEDFKFKASTIFEAAVNDRVAQIRNQLLEQHKRAIDDVEQRAQIFAENKIESVLGELCSEWKQSNAIAVDAGIKVQLAEDFMSNLRSVFEQHNVEMPKSKVDLYQAVVEEKAELQSQIVAAVDTVKQLTEELNAIRKDQIISESVSEMSAIESARFRSLVEDFDCSDEIEFRRKMSIVKQSFFESRQSKSKQSREKLAEEFVSAPVIIEETPTPSIVNEDRTMSSYLRAINGRR